MGVRLAASAAAGLIGAGLVGVVAAGPGPAATGPGGVAPAGLTVLSAPAAPVLPAVPAPPALPALPALPAPPALPALPAPPAAPAAPPGPPAWAAATAPIRPGVLTETAGGGGCTSNFVFTAGARTFLGVAAHCGGTGQDTVIDGCHSTSVPLGTAVTVRGADGRDRHATLAYSSWVTMRDIGESDPDVCAANDLALVELDPADARQVNPSIPFFGGPTGLDTAGIRPGEQVYSYGHSPPGLGITALRPKAGTAAEDPAGGRGHVIYTFSPGVAGDSGSAFLDASGAALGQLSTLNLVPLPVSNGIGDIASELAYADVHGGLGDVELALGTEPFDPVPPDVDPVLLATPSGPPLGDS